MKHSLTEIAMAIAAAEPMTDEQKLLAKLNPTASMRCLEDPDVAPRTVTIDPREPTYHRFGSMVRAFPEVAYDECDAQLYGIEKAREMYLEQHPQMKPREEVVVSRWTGMSNFDHTIDKGFADALKAAPNEAYGHYSGWNFAGRVFWDGAQFQCEVWRYHEVVEIVTASTLEDIMREVCDRYGDD
jgi:hypothetical protein